MKILFVVPYVPNMVRVRSYNLICNLVAQGHEVTVATLYSSEQDLADLKVLESKVQRVIAYPLSRWRSLWNVTWAVPSRIPLQAVFCWQPQLIDSLTQLVSSNDTSFDVVHVEHLRGTKYALALREAVQHNHIPIIWDSVDNITHLFKQSSVQSKRWMNRWITRFELGRTARYEAWLPDQFESVLVTSPVDRQAFIDLRNGQAIQGGIQVLPNGVDLHYFSPDNHVARQPETLVVSGKMSYHANITMVLFLVKEIMPLIWQQIPEVHLQVVGKDPPGIIQALARNSRIEVTGTVPDLRPYLRQATLAVAPVPYGAGIQNKVLEAMACATPVIANTQAVSALTTKSGVEIILANNPAEFAQKVIDLLKDSEQRSQIGQAGLEYVRRCHDWGGIVNRLVDIYRSSCTAH